MNTRIEEAEKKNEEIQTSVAKCVNDADNLPREENDLVEKKETNMKAMGKFTGIQYQAASEDFIYFASTKKAYDELFEALNDDAIHMIGLDGEGGCGKTTLVTEVGKQAVDRKMFDKVISITMSQTPDIRAIQGKIADMLNLRLGEESPDGRAQRLWLHLKEKKRILIIVDDLWTDFDMKKIGIRLDNVNKHTWKILITTRHKRVCTLMDCQKKIHLELLSEDESWHLFQRFAGIDDEHSIVLNDVPRKICNECMRLPIAIKIVGSLFNERKEIEWQQAYENLRASKASDDEENATSCLKLSYDHLPTQKAKQIFLLCALFPEEYHILTEDLVRYVVGLGRREISSLKSMRNSISVVIKEILDSCLLAPGSVKMHNTARDAALWIANRSDDCKILVNVDKPLSTVAEDNRIRDCFAVSSWWFNENPSFCQLHAPNLKMLLVNISAHSSLNSLDLSHITFEGIQGLEVFSLTINYKIVPISFPPTIQKLTNVRTLRLNGLKLGDISFILNLTGLEVLDLRRCYFNELPIEIRKLESLKLLDLSECHISEKYYNRAIGKCSQLEELYALPCYPEAYVQKMILDTDTLPKLQRFVLKHSFFSKKKILNDFKNLNISMFKGSKMNILQMAESISLTGLHGGCKNIIPDMVEVVGAMTNLSTLHLTDCREIECIFDATFDFGEEDLIPMLVELSLNTLDNLTELCHGPTLQVLHYFEKLEQLYVERCRNLHIIFPWECKLQNLKILSLSYCKTDEVLFSESVAQSLQQLEQLTIHGCSNLKHLIASGGSKHGGCSSEEIIPAPMYSRFLMTSLRNVEIFFCTRLESIFPICYVEGLTQLQNVSIQMADKLEYVFGECDHECLSSHQNHVMLPHLEVLKLFCLNNLVGICPENCQANWPSQSMRIIDIIGCPKLAIPWFSLKVGYDQSQHHPKEIWSFHCLQSLTLTDCKELKYLFFMETHRSLPELMELCVFNCHQLEQIAAANEKLAELPNAELYFPKLNKIKVTNCNMLKSLFPLSMVTMLPQLSTLHLSNAIQLRDVFRHSQGDGVMNELEIVLPNLTEITLVNLPNFVDICDGSNLHAVNLQKLSISNSSKTASSLRIIERKLMKEAASQDDEDSLYQYPTSSIFSEDDKDSRYQYSTSSIFSEDDKDSRYQYSTSSIFSEDDKDSRHQYPTSSIRYSQKGKSKASKDDIYLRYSKSPDSRPKGKMLNKANKVDDAKNISKGKGKMLNKANKDDDANNISKDKGKMLNKANKVDDAKDISEDKRRESLLAEQDIEELVLDYDNY